MSLSSIRNTGPNPRRASVARSDRAPVERRRDPRVAQPDLASLTLHPPTPREREAGAATGEEIITRRGVETQARVRAVILQSIPEASSINFAPHIRGPKLIFQGRYDESAPLKTVAEPLYKLLREPKRLVVFEGGHRPPMEVLVPTMNGWLDEKLGPVKHE